MNSALRFAIYHLSTGQQFIRLKSVFFRLYNWLQVNMVTWFCFSESLIQPSEDFPRDPVQGTCTCENLRRGSCPCRCKTISLIHGFRTLQNKLAEERQKSLQLHTETEDLKEEMKRQENLNAAKIRSLSRYTQLKLSIEHFSSLYNELARKLLTDSG